MKKLAYMIVGVFVLSLFLMVPTTMAQVTKPVFKYGVGGSPETIDPAQAWDSASIDILDQVMEGLVGYNLTDPELAIIPILATDLGTWSENGKELTFPLQEGVTFHDGTRFNASAVAYTFERLNHLIETEVSQIAELYQPLMQLYPETPLVVNETEIIDEYTVKFILNYPYVAFTGLLCFSGSYIVHPEMPFDRLIELNETLIGTGPFVLESYATDETHFTAYEEYWRAQPEIQEMIWILYDDDVAKQQALLAGDIHMVDGIIPDYLEEYQANPNLIVHEPQTRTTIQYMGINNELINKTYRQAISYAVDYAYILNTIMNGLAVRMVSPIPPGIKFHDPTVEPAYTNITIARQILIDAGLSKGLTMASPDIQWFALTDGDPIATFNYTYNFGNRVRGDLGLLIASNLRSIGIRLLIYGLSWPEYLARLLGDFDELNLYMIGWSADYNDPSNYINPLFSNTSLSNSDQVNDPWLQAHMMAALTIANETERRQAYSDIQHYIVEDLMPWVFLFQPISRTVHNKALGNFPRNAMSKLYFYPCTWASIGTTTTTPKPFIPGYSFIALLGAAAIAIGVLLYKRRR